MNLAALRSACLVLAFAACGGSARTPADLSSNEDLAAGEVEDFSGSVADASARPCQTETDCVIAGYVCAYAIAQGCAATSGICLPRPSGTSCGALRILCSCTTKTVDGDGDCNYPTGYASGPTRTTDPSCGADGGDADTDTDAGS